MDHSKPGLMLLFEKHTLCYSRYYKVVKSIPPLLQPLMKPFCEKVESVMERGAVKLSWNSASLGTCKFVCFN